MRKKTINGRNISLRVITSVRGCPVYAPDADIYDDYVDMLLLPAEKKAFEEHLDTCRTCSARLKKAFLRDEQVEQSDLLSAAGQKESLKKTMAYYHQIKNAPKENLTLLAAGAKRKKPVKGVAYGVAYDAETDTGSLLKCTAVVQDANQAKSKLEIRAPEVRAVKQDNIEYTISSPTNLLEQRLNDLFLTHPILQPLQLGEKMIRVDVRKKGGIGVIAELDSLFLTCLVAILSAVTGRLIDPDMAFSSAIAIDGCLEGVADIENKVRIAKEKGLKTCLIAEENRSDFSRRSKAARDMHLCFFDALDDVLVHLGMTDDLKTLDGGALLPDDAIAKKAGSPLTGPAVKSMRLLLEETVHAKKIDVNILDALDRLIPVLLRAGTKQTPITTAFVVGDPSAVKRILTQSHILLKEKINIYVEAGQALIPLLSLVNGINLGYLLNHRGIVESIINLDIDITGDYAISKMLQGINRRYALISQTTGAMVLHISSATHGAKIFNDGKLVAIYRKGKWQPADYHQFERQLDHLAKSEKLPPDAVGKICRVAVNMADLRKEGLFVFLKDPKTIAKMAVDPIEVPFSFRKEYVGKIADDDLANFAKEEGAVLIDRRGNMQSFTAFRGLDAQKISKQIPGITIQVTRDGAVVVYRSGDQVAEL
ncbi:MAG: hypothetical protein JW943_08230 [Deltaproteobacteria bacterium]|nr:hypothetical protein [Deltaproteobacteria bacterium]